MPLCVSGAVCALADGALLSPGGIAAALSACGATHATTTPGVPRVLLDARGGGESGGGGAPAVRGLGPLVRAWALMGEPVPAAGATARDALFGGVADPEPDDARGGVPEPDRARARIGSDARLLRACWTSGCPTPSAAATVWDDAPWLAAGYCRRETVGGPYPGVASAPSARQARAPYPLSK